MRLRVRAGFTLVELMVAVLLIDVGLLALVCGSAIVARRYTDIRARELAARIVSNRIQAVMAQPCGVGQSFRDVADSASYIADGSAHQFVLRTRVPC